MGPVITLDVELWAKVVCRELWHTSMTLEM